MYINVILEDVRIANEFMEIVNRMKWRNLFFMRYDLCINSITL